MSSDDGSSVCGDDGGGVYDGSGMYDGGSNGSAMDHRAAMMADGCWYAANNGTAVDGWGQQTGASGGNSQKSRQHHQFEHFCIGLCCTVDKLN